MSKEKFDDQCPDCRPILFDFRSGKPLPASDPTMQIIDGVWGKTTRQEREAFHRFTCQNSTAAADLKVIAEIKQRFEHALKS